MSLKYATIGAALALAAPAFAFAQSPASGPAQGAAAAKTTQATEEESGSWFGSVKGMFGGRGEDHSCATQAVVINPAGNAVYVKRPNCP
jgi:hypothetical protein